MSRFLTEYIAKANELTETHTEFVTITLVQPEGHVPQDIGAKAVAGEDGLLWGTVGGGRLEAAALLHAKEMLLKSRESRETLPPQLVRYDLKQDLGMVCGGAAALFFEVSTQVFWNIAVFGAGHVAQATVPLLSTFACKIVCLDPRQDWLAKLPVRPNLKVIHAPDLPAAAVQVPLDSYYVVITQGHATDLPVVRAILNRGRPRYLGVIGSLPKSRTLKAALLQEGFEQALVDLIECPIGLPIGSNSPQEIAVSIAAQILEKRGTKV